MKKLLGLTCLGMTFALTGCPFEPLDPPPPLPPDAGPDGDVDTGVPCGGTYCAPGEACCVDCDGNATCGGYEGSCPLLACPPPAPTCGGFECDAPGGGCCVGCCGEEFCPAADGTCPDLDCSFADCPPPSTCADGSACGGGEICCDNPCGGPSFCAPPGEMCPVFDCPPPPACGGVDCGPGAACCTDCDGVAFCSADGVCPTFRCPPSTCEPQDARGLGLCDLLFGVVWDGSECVPIAGCDCAGADCGLLFPTVASCERAHASCGGGGATCGGFAGATCGRGEYCDFPGAGASCGADDGTGTCAPRPDSCARVYDPVCGCDGRDYDNACIANLNGTDIAHAGTCEGPVGDCRATGCPAGSTCGLCGPGSADYTCIPDGAVCAL